MNYFIVVINLLTLDNFTKVLLLRDKFFLFVNNNQTTHLYKCHKLLQYINKINIIIRRLYKDNKKTSHNYHKRTNYNDKYRY